MARHAMTGALDIAVLERTTGGDDAVTEEILGLFVEQAELWSGLLDPASDGWRDAVHTIRGTALGIGAHDLADACARVEHADTTPPPLDRVRAALDGALLDVAAYRHELRLRELRTPAG